MQNWDDLKLILALSRYGTMRAAADALNLSTATVSRRLERCAKDLGKTLFVRRGNLWEPTPAAFELLQMAEAVMDALPKDNGQSAADNTQWRRLRVASPLDICIDALAPEIPTFLKESNGLTFDTLHEPKSLAFGEADIRLGYQQPSEGRLIRLRIGTVEYHSFVHEKFEGKPDGWVQILDFARKPTPMAEDMENTFGPPRLITTSISCAVGLLEEMHLAALLPTKFAERCAGLKPWQPEVTGQHFPVWAAYHESRKLDPDVQLAMAFVKDCFDR